MNKVLKKVLLSSLSNMILVGVLGVTAFYYMKSNYLKESSFKSAVSVVIQHEGGLVDDKSDRGGITKYGISYRYLQSAAHQPQVLSELSLTNSAQVTPLTIKKLTLQQAMNIYHTQWWQKYHFGHLSDQAIATKVFDLSVNMGETQAIKLLQVACKKEAGSPILINGQLDNQTVQSINSLNKTELHQLLYAYENAVSNHYMQIAKAHPSDKKFLSGWLHRAHDNNYCTAPTTS